MRYDPLNDPDVDPELLALEKNWKVTNRVKEDKFTGIGDTEGRKELYDGPDPQEADHFVDRKVLKKKKKEGDPEKETDEKLKKKGVKIEKAVKVKKNVSLKQLIPKTKEKDGAMPENDELKQKAKGKGKKKSRVINKIDVKRLKNEPSMESLLESVESAGSSPGRSPGKTKKKKKSPKKA